MMLRVMLTSLLLTLVCGAVYAGGQGAGPERGVGRELARFRAAHYSGVRYALSLVLRPGADVLEGAEEIRVTIDGAVKELVLDWRVAPVKEGEATKARVWDIEVNGRPAADTRETNEHIIIPGAYLRRGENVVRLRFQSPISASGSAVTRYLDREDKSEYVYTLFVPSDASTAFPCFDQPDLKARFTLDIAAPADWKVVTNTDVDASGGASADSNGRVGGSNARENARGNNSATRPNADGGGNASRHEAASGGAEELRRVRFRETEPISTYLFAFAAGPLAEFADDAPTAGTTPMRLFARRSKTEQARKESKEIFRLNRECIQFLAEYFDFKFPFPKYDLIVIPEFAYGGMEHAGATFLSERRVLFPSDPTAGDYLARAEVMFHEAAHQWFGDLVTMRWFDDLWLKEGFATFMAYKAIDRIKGIAPQPYDAWKAFYQNNKPGAYATDVTEGTTPIWQELGNLSAAKSAYGNIVYLKAPSMLKQAEFFLGADEFQKAVRLLVKEHAYGNAAWEDLVKAFERASNRKLDEWAAAWVKRRGMPDVRVRWETDAQKRISSFAVTQQNVLRGDGGAWPMRLKILLAYEDAAPEVLTVTLAGAPETAIPEAVGKRRPAFVFANYEDYGYGRFLLDEESRRAVLAGLGAVRDDFLRALLWGALWDSVREAELNPAEYLDLAIKLAGAERDEVTAQSIMNRVTTAFNRYLSEPQAALLAPRLENMIFDRAMRAETAGLRITFFRAFVANATTPQGRAALKRILRGELKIPGMTLRARDRFDIVTGLLARGDAEAPALLAKEAAADTSDDARRYAYAAGAARPDRDTKQKYFDDYANNSQLAENWIETSLGPFNHSRQSELTLPYLQRALELLPALKRTRKIFFVNNWLAAFVGGQCTEPALNTVRGFLRREQSLDRDLRRKVLEVTDGLERCVRVRSKYEGGTNNAPAAR